MRKIQVDTDFVGSFARRTPGQALVPRHGEAEEELPFLVVRFLVVIMVIALVSAISSIVFAI